MLHEMSLPWQRRRGNRNGGAPSPSLIIYTTLGVSILASIGLVRYSMRMPLNVMEDMLQQLGDAPPEFEADNVASTKSSQAHDSPSSLPTTAGSPQTQEYMELSVSSSAHSLGVVAPEYISATLDWWSLGTEGWGNASIINANLSHPNLVAAAKGLSPFFLRIGGSQADEIIYNFPQLSNASNADEIASKCKKHPQKCLTSGRWDEALNFASRSGARIVFTIAYVRHTRDGEGTNDQKDWDSSNAKQLLDYTANSGHAKLGTVYGFELGNELRHGGKITNVTRLVNAYKELRQLVDEMWGKGERTHYHTPKILGPASTGKAETTKLVAELGPHLDIISYHKYHGGGKNPELPQYARHPSFYSHPMKLSGPGEAIKKYMANHSEKAQLWVGEGAMAYNSGRRGVTDSFLGSLWFANLLGALSKTKPFAHSVYCRQALIGGYYELVQHETLVPNPDYWIGYLWKTLVGPKAVGPIQSPSRTDSAEFASQITFGCCEKPGRDSVLIHSFCAKSNNGDVVFVVINISDSKSIKLKVDMDSENRTEYLLSPNKNGYESREVLLNGQVMSIENGLLPEVRGLRRQRNEQFHIPPISIAFLVVHGTEVKECLDPTTLI